MKVAYLVAVAVLVTGWNVVFGRKIKVKPFCETIDIKACSRVGYTYTMLPNSIGHKNKHQVRRALKRWNKVLRKRCSPLLGDFLCRMHLPSCIYDQSQIPCRSVCNKIKKDCRHVMKKLKMKWHSSLRCSILPKKRCFRGVRITVSTESHQPVKSTRNKITYQESGCQKITIPMCQRIGYNYTLFPNMFNHRTQDEAALEVNQFYPAVKVECSHFLNLFLCAMYTPVCTTIGIFPPCRSLCETSRQGCEPLFNKFGFHWPEKFNCSRFPEENSGETCIPKTSPDKRKEITNQTSTISPTNETKQMTKTFLQADISQGRRCQNVSLPMCSGLGYNLTAFPNIFKHRTQKEAVTEFNQFIPLVKVQCSSSMSLFLCSMYLPVCTEVGTLSPCRSLCERSLRGCSPVMNKFGFQWPVQFNCSRFPDERKGQICIS